MKTSGEDSESVRNLRGDFWNYPFLFCGINVVASSFSLAFYRHFANIILHLVIKCSLKKLFIMKQHANVEFWIFHVKIGLKLTKLASSSLNTFMKVHTCYLALLSSLNLILHVLKSGLHHTCWNYHHRLQTYFVLPIMLVFLLFIVHHC